MTSTTGTPAPAGARWHALYEGTVWHHRHEPEHRFSQRVTMAWLDLDHLDSVPALPWCGTKPWSPIRIVRSDFLGDPGVSPAEAVRRRVEASIGVRPAGPVCVLANLRTWGWCFNPIAVYWCHDVSGAPVAELLEVTNTPWHERHTYVIDRRIAAPGEAVTFAKELHVSPFMPMDLAYRLTDAEPGETVSLRLDLLADRGAGAVIFSAGFEGRRQPFDSPHLRRVLVRTPTHRVSAGIHLQAARLWRKGATFVVHPKKARRDSGRQS